MTVREVWIARSEGWQTTGQAMLTEKDIAKLAEVLGEYHKPKLDLLPKHLSAE